MSEKIPVERLEKRIKSYLITGVAIATVVFGAGVTFAQYIRTTQDRQLNSANSQPAAPNNTIPIAISRDDSARDVPANDWRSYNRTVEGSRYSPLDEITRDNVNRLHEVCHYDLPEIAMFHTGMIVVDGTMYFTTDHGSYAIDAATCTEKWKYVRQSTAPAVATGAVRGFAYLDGRLFRGTLDRHMLALNAKTGQLIWDRAIDDVMPDMYFAMAPIAWNGVVFIGTAGGDLVGSIGRVLALDTKDGHVVWTWDVVPKTGAARATWTNPKLPISGGGMWTSLTLDPEIGILYVPVGNAAPDFDVVHRTGDNLFTDSVVALDARTGKLLAYNQVVKHDAHDWDVSAPAALLTTRDGKKIIASANKDGLLSVLDRSRLSVKGSRAPGDLPPVIPLLWSQPTTTRINADVRPTADHQTYFCPGLLGGSEWNGAAYSPQTNLLYTGAVDWCYSIQLTRELTVPPTGQFWFGAADEEHFLDRVDPADRAHGWVRAFDADTGLVHWQFQAPKPILAAVTPTAGGLVFTGDLGGQLFAFDAASGKVLWQTRVNEAIGGGIVSYRAAGRQLVGVAAGMPKSPFWPNAPDQRSQILVYGRE
jgi:alcohol dehydrogenase (cytochrome c)